MQLQQASRKKAKIKMALQGPAGSGKTYSALLIAYGLTLDWTKVAVIDSENGSSNLYSHLGNFNVLDIKAPFTPEKYIEAIRVCVKEGIEVIIIDSLSHEWDGPGGILDTHSGMTGNSFTNWSKLTPRHNAFIQEILQSPVHVIAAIRTKHDYILSEIKGKVIPQKVGLKAVMRDNTEFEFTLVFNIDIRHQATATKDRTTLFIDRPEFIINTSTGKQILEWCNQDTEKLNSVEERVGSCKSIAELLQLYHSDATYQDKYKAIFASKRQELNAISNGTTSQLPLN